MARELRADAAIVPEPGDLDVWIACRGSLLPTITVEGRSGHAGIAPRHPDDGRPRQRDREDGDPARGAAAPARGVGRCVRGTPTSRRPRSFPRWSRAASGSSAIPPRAASTATSSTCPSGPTSRASAAASSASSRTGSRARPRPTPGCARTRRASSGSIGGVPPAEVDADDPIVQIALDATARDRAPERARRPRQLARRRDVDRRGRDPLDLPRPRGHPSRPHGRGVDRRSPTSSTARRRSPSRRCASAASSRRSRAPAAAARSRAAPAAAPPRARRRRPGSCPRSSGSACTRARSDRSRPRSTPPRSRRCGAC